MKTRYKILIVNVCLSVLYYVFILLNFTNNKFDENEIVNFLSLLVNAISYLVYYNWINVLWLGLIIFGLIKKNKEFVKGGIFSIVLSLLMFLFSILHFQV